MAWLILGVSALVAIPAFSPSVTMIVVAVSLYLGIKTHVLILAVRSIPRPSWVEVMAWYGGWPGLQARDFFDKRVPSLSGRSNDHFVAMAALAMGVLCLLGIAPRMIHSSPVLSAWFALIGLILMLHFGVFRLLVVFWNANGRSVKPIMKAPLLAITVTEFWGRRWNLAFRDYVHQSIFLPLARKYSVATGTLGGFLFSGLMHEAVISLPARSGLGLPSLYFLLQGLAVVLERSVLRSFFRSAGRTATRIWTLSWVLLPVPLLFHLPFLHNVMLPIIKAVSFR